MNALAAGESTSRVATVTLDAFLVSDATVALPTLPDAPIITILELLFAVDGGEVGALLATVGTEELQPISVAPKSKYTCPAVFGLIHAAPDRSQNRPVVQ